VDIGPPPTDLELMLYADGELEEGRCREVEAYVTRDARCRAKVAGLEVVGAVFRERAGGTSAADDIADAVMARIQVEARSGMSAGARATVNGTDGSGEARAVGSTELSSLAGGAAPKAASTSFEHRPANDNARRIFTLAALAVAAAAAMMIWGRTEGEPPPIASTVRPSAVTVEVPLQPEPAPTVLAEPASAAHPGVEVAAVDFGARMGTIFYIPSGSAASSETTTVVWLSDEGTGGE
jgi:hypothetical protein